MSRVITEVNAATCVVTIVLRGGPLDGLVTARHLQAALPQRLEADDLDAVGSVGSAIPLPPESRYELVGLGDRLGIYEWRPSLPAAPGSHRLGIVHGRSGEGT